MLPPIPRKPLTVLALTLALTVSSLPAFAAKKAFALQDLYRLKAVAEPSLSPDGKTVVFAVSTTDLKGAKKTTSLWRVGTDGSGLQRLTFSEAADTRPVFSPDGKTIAFVSTRSGEPQVWFLPAGGGEAEKRTSFPGGVGSPVFSRDGKRLALVAEVHPECGADAACNRRLLEATEKGKMRAHLADRLLFRHWDSWKDGTRSHVLVLDLATGTPEKAELLDATPGDWDSPVLALGGRDEFCFSTDGSRLYFSSNRAAEPALSTNSDLYEATLADGGEARTRPLTTNPAWDGSPRLSPDGKTLAFRTHRIPGFEADTFRIALLDLASGKITGVAADFDDTISDLRFGPDGRTLYFTADVRGRTPLHAVDLASGKIRVLTDIGVLDAFEISPDGSFAVVIRRTWGSPAELWRIDLTGKVNARQVRLTSFNADLADEVDMVQAEEVTIPGAGGVPMQAWLVKPHEFDPKKNYPAIVNVHGGPQMQWADAFRGDGQVYAGAGYVTLFPNPHGSTGFGAKYTAAISDDWDGKVMGDVAAATDWLAKQPYVDRERMGAMGWSWGGYAMMWLEGHTKRFKAIASMMGVYDLRAMFSSTEELWFPLWDLKGTPWDNPRGYAKRSPSSFVREFSTPTLVITGQQDFRVPYTQSVAFFTDLQARKIPSRLIVFEKAGHWPSWYEMSLYYAAHLDWFAKYLGGAPSPIDPRLLARNVAFEERKSDVKGDQKAATADSKK